MPRRRTGEPVVPMINVVFLLLIFFLMSASIAPTPPFDVTLAQSGETRRPEARAELWISASGQLSFQGTADEALWDRLATTEPAPLSLRVDARFSAPDLARILSRLASIGWNDVTLMTAPEAPR